MFQLQQKLGIQVWKGVAITRILFGQINPSGKLPITFPRKIEESPAHKSTRTFPGENLEVYYDEGIFIDYRYFDKEKIDPRFEFGYGLSYTDFEYNQVHLSKQLITDDSKFTLSVDITNTGNRDGAEIVQVYSHDVESSVTRPPKELVGFMKVFLKPLETQTIHIPLKPDDFAFYNTLNQNWIIEEGLYELLVCSSSRNIEKVTEVRISDQQS